MKINRNERITLIECLRDSIEADEQVLESMSNNPDEDIECSMDEIHETIKSKQELMQRLGEPIGYFNESEKSEE